MVRDAVMIGNLKPLGSTPSFDVRGAWNVARLWSVARPRSERNRSDLGLLSVFLGRGVILYGEGGGQVHKPSLDVSGYQAVYPGDLVLNNQQAWRGSVGVSRHPGIISPAYLVFALSDVLDPQFADYLFQSRVMVAQFVTSSKGVGDIQRDVHPPWLKNSRVPLPTLQEQIAIVRFLDYMDRRIRRYIRAKQKLINLLEEQEQAIIHRAVTHGVSATSVLKQLGSAPDCQVNAQWRVARLWQIAEIRSERSKPELPLLSVFLGRGVIPYGEGGGQVHKPSLDLSSYQVVHPGDLVLNNQQAWRGSVGVSKHHGIISPAYVVLRLSGHLHPHFANYLFQSRVMVNQFVVSSKGVGDIQRDIHVPWLRNVLAPIPPFEDQAAISAFLDREVSFISDRSVHVDRGISLLREYHTRLIADVVTGKLDVREAVAHLPDEAQELAELVEEDESEVGVDDDAIDDVDSDPEEVDA